MELSKELISEVLKERTSLHQPLLKEAELYLSTGLSIAIHILLGHSDCKATEPSRCPANQQLEVWTLKLLTEGAATVNQMPPMFLKQAIRSQLYFSPIKSWFSTLKKSNPGFCCLYRISTSAHFEVEKEGWVGEHIFPVCKLDGRMFLQAGVKWLKKEGFPSVEEVPVCPSKKINDDQWVFPCCTSTTITACGENLTDRKKSFSRQNSKDVAVNRHLTPTSRKASCGKSPQRRNDPPKQIPVPTKRNTQKYLVEKLKNVYVQAGEIASSSGSESESTGLECSASLEESVEWPTSRRKRVPSGLLCNFEESALNGRLEPVNNAQGFQLQIAVAGTFSSQLTIPCTTSYFKGISEADEAPSLYLGHCNLSKIRRKELQIPKMCTLQAVLLNPQGSVVKIFLVNVDVRDMPARSKTFLRQRTFAVPTEQQQKSTNKNATDLNGCTKSVLKFLIHIRLASDYKSRVFLHSDIKMLLSNKGSDLEGLELISTKLDASTEMPQEPKYSPIK
uniref:Atos-like conserved domain-containing protein n=1 Tax=Ditylenchus dipsaci TaxID=166011 RepID=A0A915D7R3_9BILA